MHLIKNSSNINNHFRLSWINSNRSSIWMLVFTGGCGALVSAIAIGKSIIVLLFFPALFSIFYFTKPFMLRNKIGLKAFIIAFIWSAVIVAVPMLLSLEKNLYSEWRNVFVSKIFILKFAETFLFVAALALGFDIRDYVIDKKQGVQSFPVIAGISATKAVAVSLLLVAAASTYYQNKMLVLPEYIMISSSLVYLLGALLLLYSNQNKKESYFLFWMDGLMVLKPLLTYSYYSFS